MKCFPVSIHLMLLFIKISKQRGRKRKFVSIHLMLLFIRKDLRLYRRLCTVSIHLMLLFIRSSFAGHRQDPWFQYISCCCLSNAFAPFLHFIIPDFPLFFKLFSYFYQAVSQIPVTVSQSLIFLVFPGFVTFSPFFRLVKILLYFP